MEVRRILSVFRSRIILHGTIIGLLLLCLFLNPFSLDEKMNRVLCFALFMIYSWVSELLPYAVTALVPIVFFPLLNILNLTETARAYSDPVIFLFMGGFFLALAIEKWNLHKRIALFILMKVGCNGNRIVFGFLLASFLISMWISNTATTMLMFPIAISVLNVMEKTIQPIQKYKLGISLLLCIAYGSNLGGLATVIGTPPNTVYVGYIHTETDYTITFLNWMLLCLPIAICIAGIFYFILTRILFSNNIPYIESTRSFIQTQWNLLGNLSISEKRVLIIFSMTALAWMTKDVINYLFNISLHDAMIAIACGLCLFSVPSGKNDGQHDLLDVDEPSLGRLLEWRDTQKMQWGILIMFGGGLALAKALEDCGLMDVLAKAIASQSEVSYFYLILIITVVSIFLSEVLSNVAQVIIMTPVITSMAISLNINPLLLGIPMTLAASCASMLPMGTPPNAIIFSSGKLPLREMLKAGFILNLISIIIISVFSYYLLPVLFD